jgi:hypothetical protein
MIMTRFKQPSMPRQPTVRFGLDKKAALVLGELGQEQLKQFCGLLNSSEQPELKDHLRQLVKLWQDSGPNLLEMMSETVPFAYGIMKHFFIASWVPTREGRANLCVTRPDNHYERLFAQRLPRKMPDGGTSALSLVAEAWVEFGIFTLNPYCEKVAGPCPRCGNYYVKNRRSQKVYCTRQCGNAATSIARMTEKYRAEQKRKIVLAKALIREWNTLKDRSGLVWKVWLKKHEPSITDKFVTLWVNKGELPKLKTGRKP